jgi:hypothetical protein
MAVATGVARPLVERERRRSGTAWIWIAAFVVGILFGAAGTGVALGVFAAMMPPLSLGALLGVGVGLLVVDVTVSRQYSILSLPRQTCSLWFHRMSPGRTFLIWGADLGLGFSTFRVSALYWVVVAWTIATAQPLLAPVVMVAYAVGLMSSFGAATFIRPEQPPASVRDRIHCSLREVRIVSVAMTLILLGIFALTS